MEQGNIFISICQEFCSPWAGTPRDQVPSGTRYPPLDQVPPDQVHPQGPGTPLGPGTAPGQVHPQAGIPPGPGTPLGPGTPPIAVHAARYGQQAGGTHPTGMHSC